MSTVSNEIFKINNLTIRYGDNPAVKDVSFSVPKQKISAVIGPSGCGKSTMLRAFNRMNDFIPDVNMDGEILYLDQNIYGSSVDPVKIRRHIGMVFQKPNPFPKSIFKNISWGPLINGFKGNIQELVEKSLKQAALWDEVKDRLDDSALGLSGGQQQRLCIARALAMEPDVILMDEPCSALDPISTAKIEDLMDELKARYTIVIVTHNMQQAARVSDLTGFFYQGELIEFGDTKKMFTKPKNKKTEEYITGRFG